ncbi:aminoglycoside phosphotransferase family protein [Cytobacillus depressus]|uniref:Aminoglycoside phosphotransferase family protein n=1 Tax=Cytobacillus depressus TaxID=1602942 RepID=A0A6L3V5U7_9BACI|nr:aminoglycoside phosphotransferase family protein [Cytobacillus depressus]KAB2334547.1 aminoglycoside phosphotransferase family protein [Cytobacillus depressus]
MNLTNVKIEELKSKIRYVLTNKLNWKINEITFLANGVINAVFLVKEKHLGMLAVRTPWRSEENMMDKQSSGIISIKKEAAISEYCYKFHIPVPKVYKLYLSDDINFLVSEYVPGDDQGICSFDIGELTSQIHKVPVDGLSIIDQKEKTLSSIIVQRITERAQNLSQLINSKIIIPESEEMESILITTQNKDCLLHLDVRLPNLIGKNGKIQAILDWDNAFIGDPIMELMRISETQELKEEEFLKGCRDVNLIENTNEIIQSIYRLDTALMLSILFISFIHDPDRRDYYLKRVHFLSEEIMKGT